jgi:putative ATP-dependent endonuclease of OLD family
MVLDRGTTYLVGENNTGKSAVLAALETAFGRRRPDRDDLHLDAAGNAVDSFTVDLVIVPDDDQRFEATVGTLFGYAIRRDASGREFVAIRTSGTVGADRSGLDVTHIFIEGWTTCGDADGTAVAEVRVSQRHLELISFAILGASRDLVDNLRQRTSHWGRILAQLNLPDDVVSEIEATLSDVGQKVVDESEVLTRLRDQLAEVQRVLPTVDVVNLEPVPVKLDELARAIDVTVGAPDSAPVPLRLEGLGSRSLAELMVFQAFATTVPGVGATVVPHIVSCFEEPEAHLHPQAQIAVAGLIDRMPGQRIVTTHSPQLAGEADLRNVRILRRTGAGVDVRVASALETEDVIKVRRLAERPFGQTLFARLVLIGDGATERASIPVFARAYWDGVEVEGKGVTIVDPASLSQADALVKVLEDYGIPWLIFADGDDAAEQALVTIGGRIGRQLERNSPEVVMLPAGQGFEEYLLAQGLRTELESGIASLYGQDALADFKRQGSNDQLSDDDLVLKFLKRKKGSYGGAIAEAIVATKNADSGPTIPELVLDLLKKADAALGKALA